MLLEWIVYLHKRIFSNTVVVEGLEPPTSSV